MTEDEAKTEITQGMRQRGALTAGATLPRGVWRHLREGGYIERLLSYTSVVPPAVMNETIGIAAAFLQVHKSAIEQFGSRLSSSDMPEPFLITAEKDSPSAGAGQPQERGDKTGPSRPMRPKQREGLYRESEVQRQRVAQEFYCRQMELFGPTREFRFQLRSLISNMTHSDTDTTHSDQLLKRSDIWRFLTSPLTQYFSFDELRSADISPLTSEVKAEPPVYGTSGPDGTSVPTIRVRVKATDRRGQPWDDFSRAHRLFDRRALLQHPGGDDDALFLLGPIALNQGFIGNIFLTDEGGGGSTAERGKIEGYRDTIVSEALRVAAEMSTGLNGRRFVRLRDALVLLLTGELPEAPMVSFAFSFAPNRVADGSDQTVTAARVSVSAAPWVSAETLADLYRHWQSEFSGGDSRPISARSLEIFNFVNNIQTEYAMEGKKCTWPELYRLWTQNLKMSGAEEVEKGGYRNLRFRYMDTEARLFPNPLA